MITILVLFFKDINQSCYSSDGKKLTKVTDPSPYLKISAKCEVILDECFRELNTLISFSFEIDPNITTIGTRSFWGCKNLSIINLSSCTKLKTISYAAFGSCEKVSEILFPRGLLEIQKIAFFSNKLVTIVKIPASVKFIDREAFYFCEKLENAIFEEGSNVKSLENNVFAYTNITSFQIPENVSKVDGWIFSNAKLKNLTSILWLKIILCFQQIKVFFFFICNRSFETYVIPDFVTILGDHLFYDSIIKTIVLPNSITTIGYRCFCFTHLITIQIPQNVKYIDEQAFFLCSELINATFLGAPDYLGDKVFDNCKKLEIINFPNSPMNINGNNFITNNTPKTKMYFTNKTLFRDNSINRITNVSVSYINDSDLIITPRLFVMNANQTIIYEFWGYNYFYYSTIPKSVSCIKERAFQNSIIPQINLEKDSKLSVIENFAFLNCSKLVSFNFSSTYLNTIGVESFKDCIKLTSVSFASSDLVIMDNAFENCISLVSVANVINIPNRCFRGCVNLTNIGIQGYSKMIGYKSFENCYSIESISIPSSVQYISEYSFLNCRNLKSMIFPERNHLVNISINSFSGCNLLQNISNFESDKYKCIDNTIYTKNETGEYLIFHLNRSLDKTLFINCSVICTYSFNECNNIYNINILPNSVSLIEKYSFNNCLNLQHINFPLSVETVESNSFFECRSIRCPLIIENKKLHYIRMINESGIPLTLIISCRVIHGSKKPGIFKKFYNSSTKLIFGQLSK